MNRRSFFSRIIKAAVIAVSAPVILRDVICAELPVVEEPFWIETICVARYMSPAYDAFVEAMMMDNPAAFSQFELSREEYDRRFYGRWK